MAFESQFHPDTAFSPSHMKRKCFVFFRACIFSCVGRISLKVEPVISSSMTNPNLSPQTFLYLTKLMLTHDSFLLSKRKMGAGGPSHSIFCCFVIYFFFITGTLTQNEMIFKRLHLGTVSYGTDTMDEIQSHIINSYSQVSHFINYLPLLLGFFFNGIEALLLLIMLRNLRCYESSFICRYLLTFMMKGKNVGQYIVLS